MKFPIKDFFSKCDQILRKLLISSHLLRKSLIENIFCAVFIRSCPECFSIKYDQFLPTSKSNDTAFVITDAARGASSNNYIKS